MGVVPALAADLPQSVVRLAPVLADELPNWPQHALLGIVERAAVIDERESALDHGPIDVELKLLDALLPTRTGLDPR
jgi:hypothetical protein